MAVEALKSASVTNMDATPIVLNNQGAGAPSARREVDDYTTISAAASVGSTYRLVRVPSTAKVKAVRFESEAQGAGKVQIGVYKTAADGGAVVDVKFFSDDIDLTSAVATTDKTYSSGSYTLDKRSQPLWQAAGLSADVPSGYLDIALTVHTTAVTTGTGKAGLLASFVV